MRCNVHTFPALAILHSKGGLVAGRTAGEGTTVRNSQFFSGVNGLKYAAFGTTK
jgi:hypothetical protein